MNDFVCICGNCDYEWKQSGNPDTLKVSCPECFDDDDIAWHELELEHDDDVEHCPSCGVKHVVWCKDDEESNAEAKLRGVLLACRNMRRNVNLTPEVEVWLEEIERQAGD